MPIGRAALPPTLGNDLVDLAFADSRAWSARFVERISTEAERARLESLRGQAHEGSAAAHESRLNGEERQRLESCSVFDYPRAYFLYLWSIWALKESAYKALQRHCSDLPFLWRSFETTPELDGVICNQELFLPGDVRYNEAWIHARVARDRDELLRLGDKIVALEEDGSDDSTQVRRLASRMVAERYGFAVEQISWQKSGQNAWGSGPPCCVVNGDPLPILASFSHHGRYIACALLDESSD